MGIMAARQTGTDLAAHHRELYGGPAADATLRPLIRAGAHTRLTPQEVLEVLRISRAVFFDTHVCVVSGHHTSTYLRFDSVVRFPELLMRLAGDMAGWIARTFHREPITGIVATTSAAEALARGIAEALHGTMPLRVTLTPYSGDTGRIGTEIVTGAIHSGERFLALNDVTTRGNCVSKLGGVITDRGGLLAGMMVFARRDSGQFPLMNELIARHPFYYTTDLDMPQWEPADCPECQSGKPLLSWKDMPEL